MANPVAAAGLTPPRRPISAWTRPLLQALSPAGPRARLSILIFHRVLERADAVFPEAIDAAQFRERMDWVSREFTVLPLAEAVIALERGRLPARALAITFDDGYADNARVALPILREFGLCATFFVASGFLDGGRMWNDTVIEAVRSTPAGELDFAGLGLGRHRVQSLPERRAAIDATLMALKYRPLAERQSLVDAIAARCGCALPDDLMMTREELRSLANAGMEIGGHTVSHPILARLAAADAREEMANGRDQLEAIVGQPVRLFAYPNGKPNVDYTAEHAHMAKALGFVAACSTAAGAAKMGDSPHELPRFTPWDRTAARWGARLARNMRTRVVRADE